MDCAVCGQPGATKCTAVDEYGNPEGDWVHSICAPKVNVGAETQTLAGCIGGSRVFRAQRVVVPGMRIKRGTLVQRMDLRMRRL